MSRTLQEESVLISADVLEILESCRMRMHARDYRDAAAHVIEAMSGLDLADLVVVARGRRAVLADAAASVLFDVGCDDLIDESVVMPARREMEALIERL